MNYNKAAFLASYGLASQLPAADRQTTFTQMMEIALGVAVAMAKKEG